MTGKFDIIAFIAYFFLFCHSILSPPRYHYVIIVWELVTACTNPEGDLHLPFISLPEFGVDNVTTHWFCEVRALLMYHIKCIVCTREFL